MMRKDLSGRRPLKRSKVNGYTHCGTVASVDGGLGQAVLMGRRHCRLPAPRSSFAGFRFPPEVVVLAVRWYLRYSLSYRDIEELLAERGIQVDHVTIYRWVQRLTPLLIDAARQCQHATGDRRFVPDQAPTYPRILDELLPAACHVTEQYGNNSVRNRSRAIEGPAAADAWPETAPHGTGDYYRTRVRPL